MRAWLLPSKNGLESLELATAVDPIPSTGEVLLRVRYAALNPADAWLAKGMYPAKPALPHVLGRDGIGEVVAVGSGVDNVRVGDVKLLLRSEVGVTRWGTLAEQVVVPDESLVDPPPGWTAEQSAAGPLVYLTAFQALTLWDDLPERAVVLITGAAGGVGVAAVHLAKAMGHLVLGTSRSETKRRLLRDIGVDQAIDSTLPDWPRRIAEAMNGVGVDLAIDGVGGEGFASVIAALADLGRVSSYGQSAGPVPSFKPATLFFKRLRVGGVAVNGYTAEQSRDAWRQIVRLLSRTGAKPIVDRVFELIQVKEAFAALESSPVGKIVIRVGA